MTTLQQVQSQQTTMDVSDRIDPLVGRCPECRRSPCCCEWIARAKGAEKREKAAIADAYKWRELWEAAASCLQNNVKKIRPRGKDERRLLDIADKQMCGHFWSGRTNGWLPEAEEIDLFD